MQKLPFMKLAGSGNDFILLDNRSGAVPVNEETREFVRNVCARGTGLGADGLILIENSDVADIRWQFYNADGSTAEMCGNGSRCAARFAWLKGITPRELTLETVAGIVRAEITGGRNVKVQLTAPHGLQHNVSVEIEGATYPASCLNTGVPHCVYFVDDIDKADVFERGRATRYHELFQPRGTNVNFIQVTGPHTISIRTYERGVENETLACGTGSVAAAIVAGSLGMVNSPVMVHTRSGAVLKIYFVERAGNFQDVFLEGDATVICEGELWEEAWR